MERPCSAGIHPRGSHLIQVPHEHRGKEGMETLPPDSNVSMTQRLRANESHSPPPKTRQLGELLYQKINGYHLLQYPNYPKVPKNAHPLHQRTVLCRHTPLSLPSRPSNSAAGSATPAPQGCGMAKTASAGREGPGHSCGPSLTDPRRSDWSACHHQSCSLYNLFLQR